MRYCKLPKENDLGLNEKRIHIWEKELAFLGLIVISKITVWMEWMSLEAFPSLIMGLQGGGVSVASSA